MLSTDYNDESYKSQWFEWSSAVQDAAASLPGPLIVEGLQAAGQLTEADRGELMGPTEGALGSRRARL